MALLSRMLMLTLLTAITALALPPPPFTIQTPNMTERPAMPRLVIYQQTHHVNETYVSLLPLIKTRVTHVVIAAFHLNDGGTVALNDHGPGHERFNTLWAETKQLQAAGIKVMAMFGGAAQGTYLRLQLEPDRYYRVLKDTLQKYKFDGVDLDVEEPTTIEAIQDIIRRLKQDLGPEFIISLAPVYQAMFPSKRTFMGLSHRMLNATSYPAPDPVIAAFCRSAVIRTKRNLSGFDYIDLEAGPTGKLIDFYNVQLYNGWGDPCASGAYQAMIDVGWKPERVLLGVLTNPGNGRTHKDIDDLMPVIDEQMERYGDRFGGVMGWEYFNAGMHEDSEGPWDWVDSIAAALRKS